MFACEWLFVFCFTDRYIYIGVFTVSEHYGKITASKLYTLELTLLPYS